MLALLGACDGEAPPPPECVGDTVAERPFPAVNGPVWGLLTEISPTNVAYVGDFDGDGYDDAAAGDDATVLLLRGGPGAPDDAGPTLPFGDETSDVEVRRAGDVDGDGLADVALAEGAEGAIVFGDAAGAFAEPVPIVPEAGGYLRLVGVGDVDADGYDDLGVGDPGFDGASGDAYFGRVLVYRGSVTGLEAEATTVWVGEGDTDGVGGTLAPAGDLDGDGHDDFVVSATGTLGELRTFFGAPEGLEDGGAIRAGNTRTLVGEVDARGAGPHSLLVRDYEQVRLFEFDGSRFPDTPEMIWQEPEGADYLADVTAGDVDGDGDDEVILGVHAWDAGGYGEVLVWEGRPAGPDSERPFLAMAPPSTGYTQVEALDGRGDLDGDGRDDVLVGTRSVLAVNLGCTPGDADGDGSLDAACWGDDCDDADARVFVGAVDLPGDGVDQDCDGEDPVATPDDCGCSEDPPWSSEDTLSWRLAGTTSFAPAGDVDGDGRDEVAVRVEDDAGTSALYLLPDVAAGGGAPLAAFVAEDGEAVGSPVGPAGDLDGDGFDEIVTVAADLFVYSGSADGLAPVRAEVPSDYPSWVLPLGDVDGDGRAELFVDLATVAYGGAGGVGSERTEEFAQRIGAAAAVGDVDGDGLADMLAATSWEADGRGAVALFGGAAEGLDAEAEAVVIAEASGTGFGAALAAAGDVDGDGHPDVMIHEPTSLPAEGRVHVLPGSAAGLGSSPLAVLPTTLERDLPFGTLGDVDGDGFSEVRVDTVDGPRVYCGSAIGPLGADPAPTPADDIKPSGDLYGDGFAGIVYADAFEIHVVPGDAPRRTGCSCGGDGALSSLAVALALAVGAWRTARR
ncbi:MAG: FG-GAP repeat domain-containing protein [Myxococcota bacterium]